MVENQWYSPKDVVFRYVFQAEDDGESSQSPVSAESSGGCWRRAVAIARGGSVTACKNIMREAGGRGKRVPRRTMEPSGKAWSPID